jgi:hypothetical protein
MRTLGRGARLALVCGIWMVTSGCFLNALFSSVVVIGEGSHTAVTLQASATLRACSVLPGTDVPVHCSYVIDGEDIGSDARLASPFAVLAFLIDPLILQVPDAASNFSGTFGGSSITGSLSITEVPGTLPADISAAITPEPGTKLVIVDFPNPPPPLNQSFGFTLNFQLPGDATPVHLKALFAGRVESNGQTFFVPLLPCETSFANIPTITLPQSSTFQNVSLPITGVQGCAGRLYTLSAAVAQAVPTMSTWVLLLLSATTAGYGVYRLRLRYREVELR